MNKAAQALGRLAKGVPKTISAAERERRRKRLSQARKLRWTKAATQMAKIIETRRAPGL